MSDDDDRRAWAAEQAARDALIEKQRERERKARARSARNAQRKIERLRRELEAAGEITEFEEEFAGSVAERLDRFGAAFANPELGRPGDALSGSQKRVVAMMKKKAKEARAAKTREPEGDEAPAPAEPTRTPFRPSVVTEADASPDAPDAERRPRGFTPRVVK